MHDLLQVQEDGRFELVPGAPPRFGLVCFRLCGHDASTKALLEAVNESGKQVAFICSLCQAVCSSSEIERPKLEPPG